MPSSKSNRSSNSSRNSNSSSSSSSSTKQNMYAVMFLVLIIILFALYYLTYKSNRDAFTNNSNTKNKKMSGGSSSSGSNSSSGTPNLKPSQGETVVALFYADWCPHCVEFKPDYKKAMSSLSGNKYKGKALRLELVDCVANKSIASENNVSGFPTVKIFTDDNKSSEYSGERTYEGLTSYFS